MVRDFNANWKFYKLNEEDKAVMVNLPHDAMILEERKTCANGAAGGWFPGGHYVYEKEFELTKEDLAKYVAVFFEGVYRNTTVYINGKNVCFHAYGYTEFEVDLSDNVVEGKNVLKVDVDNSLEPNSRWYSGSGIYRPVSLIIKDKDYIKNLKVETVSINPATIKVSCDNADAVVEVYDGNALVVNGPVGELVVPNAKLWDDLTPNLYRIVVKTNKDEVSLNYGIREIKWSPETGVTVNGREVKFRGSCIHHDNGVLGAIDLPDASDRRIRILKEQGYNAIRSAHNPCSRQVLDACNKYGVYVMDEAFDMWFIPKTYHDYSRDFEANYKDDIKAMVAKNYNYSCVLMYSIGNENSEPSQERGMKLQKELAKLVKSLDSTRIVTMGANLMLMGGMKLYKDTGEYKKEPIDQSTIKDAAALDKTGSTGFNMMMGLIPNMMTKMVKGKKFEPLVDNLKEELDILGLNYGFPRYELDFKRDPNRIYVGSETFNNQIVTNWELVKKYHQLVGDFCWTGWDYLGEAASCGCYDYGRWKGLPIADGAGAIDLVGNPTPVNYFMQIEYGTYNKPYIAVSVASYYKEKYMKGGWRMNNYIHSWSWEGCEGVPVVVEVYTTATKVDLFLNDKKIKTAKVKGNIAKFKTKYASGSLKAVAYDANNNVVGEDLIKTANEETVITLRADKTTLNANGLDLCHLHIDLTDNNGEVKPTREDEVTLEVIGDSAVLAGFGSGRTKIEGAYNKTTFTSHFGQTLAVFRATYTKGETKVLVKVNGLATKELTINVK